MAAQKRQTEVEPLLDALPFLGPNDRRRAKTKTHALSREAVVQRTNPCERRRGMSQERIEADLRRAVRRGRISVLDAINLRGELERLGCIDTRRAHARNCRNHFLHTRATLGPLRFARPVASEQQLLDGLLTEMILLAHRQEETVGQRARVERAEREGCVAESSELFAQRRDVERTFARRRKRDLSANRD